MDKIASFKVDHLKLKPGLYVSRKDYYNGVCVTTFDMRVTQPNFEPVIDNAALHTIEHLGATYLRNCPIKDKVVYFGPMGCRTGFYILLFGELNPQDIFGYIGDMCGFIENFEGDIPGAEPEECGNYSEQNLNMAKYFIARYRAELKKYRRFDYPQ